jgi:hypothetical protein
MMGRMDLPGSSTTRVALWGDSQAEGVCLPDDQKLWAVLERQFEDTDVLPLAESGDNAGHWLAQFANVEQAFDLDAHLILIHELADLKVLSFDAPGSRNIPKLPVWIDYVPDFVLASGRRLLFTETNQRRELRFTIGPVNHSSTSPDSVETTVGESGSWATPARRLRAATNLPITVVYAPIIGSSDVGASNIGSSTVGSRMIGPTKVDTGDGDDAATQCLAAALGEQRIGFIDCRDRFRNAIKSGRYPHGFHNGRIGSGHLNALGNRLIAETVSDDRETVWQQSAARN